MVCELTVPGDPQSKGRPRVYQGHGITPTRTREAENRVYSEWRNQYPRLPPYEGPVCLTLTFWTATRRGRDWDNLAKLFTDALNGVAYMDDRQIIEASVHVHRPDQYGLARTAGRANGKAAIRSHGTASHTRHTHRQASISNRNTYPDRRKHHEKHQ